MLMNFSERKGGGGPQCQKLSRRTGHGIVRVNDSLFVAGGVDSQGEWVHEVLQINTQNGDLNSLILDNTLALEGFSMFSLQENIYLWGGKSISKSKDSIPQHSDGLLHFDGARFNSLKQKGKVPSPRADHLSVSFSNKYLIIFAGHNHTQLFNDWYLLNIKTFEWRKLLPSLALGPISGGRMVWLAGRGILMLNQLFDQERQLYLYNQFFQFKVSDFDRGKLTLTPIDLLQSVVPDHFLMNQLTVVSNTSFLIWGGYHRKNMRKHHGLSVLVDLQNESVEELQLEQGCCLGVQALFYKNHLHLLGGGEPNDPQPSPGYRVVPFQVGKRQFKRHVCQMCKLYFDEEWTQTTREIYHRKVVQAELDYGYQTKMDNRSLQKFSTYIRQELYAFILILSSLSSLSAEEIDVGVSTMKKKPEDETQASETHYIRLGCNLKPQFLPHIANEIVLEGKLPTDHLIVSRSLSEAVLGLKLGSYRLGPSCLVTFNYHDTLFVLFFSSNQIDVPHSNYSVCPAFLYSINSKGQCSCPITRSIVAQNLRPIFENPHDYETIHGSTNFTIICICSEQFKQQLQFQQTSEPDTGQSSLYKNLEEDHRRSIPLMQLAFLPYHHVPIFIEGTRLSLVHLSELLHSDLKSKILQQAHFTISKADRDIFRRVSLFHYSQEYWFKRVLIYHKGRLVSHFRQPNMRVCGLVQLQDMVALDITGNNLVFQKDRLAVERLFNSLEPFKRPCQH